MISFLPATVKTSGVITQLVQDLVHLKRGGDGLDEHGGTHRTVWDTKHRLSVGDNVVPQASLEV